MEKKNQKKISSFSKEYPLIFKKYHTLSKIANGAFSEIYSGTNIINKEKVAIKIEKRNIKNKHLESECYTLFTLRSIGIPKVLSFGHNKDYDILVMPLLGKSLLDIFNSKNLNYEFKDICLIAIQIIDRIQWVHSRKIIHRDIKPDNILIGLKDPHLIYLIDFGLSQKFQSTKTGKHIKISRLKTFTGSINFCSSNALRLLQQSRRDDLESIGYMLVYLMKGGLPWQNVKIDNKKENYFKVAQIKKLISPEILCKDLPKEFAEYLRYVKNLKFEKEPNYAYLRSLFVKMMEKQGFEEGRCFFSWVNLNDMNIKYIKHEINLSKRSSSRKRVINRVRKTLENTRKNHSENKKDKDDFLSENCNLDFNRDKNKDKDNFCDNYNKYNLYKKANNNCINIKLFNKNNHNLNLNILNTLNTIEKSNIKENNNKTNFNYNYNYRVSSPLALAYNYEQHNGKRINYNLYTNINDNIKNNNIKNNWNYNNLNYNNLKNVRNSQGNICNNNIIKINPYKNKNKSNLMTNNYNYKHRRVSSINNLQKQKELLMNSQIINNSLLNKSSIYKKNNIIILNNNNNNNNLYNKNDLFNINKNTIDINNKKNYLLKQNNRKIYDRNMRKFKLFNSAKKSQNFIFNSNNNIFGKDKGIKKIKIYKINSPTNKRGIFKIRKINSHSIIKNNNCNIF